MLDNDLSILYPKLKEEEEIQLNNLVFKPSNFKDKNNPLIFSKEQCNWVINLKNKINPLPALVGGETDQDSFKKDIRDAQIYAIPLDDSTEPLYRKIMLISQVVNKDYRFDIDGIPHPLQLIHYKDGGHYSWHCDNNFMKFNRRKISVVVTLSDPSTFEGGDLILNTDGRKFTMDKEQGMVVTFPSFILHKVTPVTKGERWSLVSWIEGSPFK